MSTSTAAARPGRLVLADLVRVDGRTKALARDAALVVGGAAFVGLAAQVAVPIPGTPVPVTLQTFAVLTGCAALGSVRGLAAMLLYAAAGLLGVPWFAAGQSGFAMPSFGYVVGFVLAAVVVGRLAERGGDRTPLRTAVTMVAGNLAIYAAGVGWLIAAVHLAPAAAVLAGVVPFLLGDALKLLLAMGVLPAAWRLARHRTPEA